MLQRLFDLTDKVLDVTYGIGVPRYPDDDSYLETLWYAVVTRALYQQNKRLHSVAFLLRSESYDYNSAVVLTRSIFECAADLVYMAHDKEERLVKYLKHGGVPMNPEEMSQRQNEISSGVPPTLSTRRWEFVSSICENLGSVWEKVYTGDSYRLSSVVAHNGAYTLSGDYSEIVQPREEKATARVLYTALSYHLKIAEVVAWVFPKSIDIRYILQFNKQLQQEAPLLL